MYEANVYNEKEMVKIFCAIVLAISAIFLFYKFLLAPTATAAMKAEPFPQDYKNCTVKNTDFSTSGKIVTSCGNFSIDKGIASTVKSGTAYNIHVEHGKVLSVSGVKQHN